MKFYEFNPNLYKTQDDVAKMAGSAVKKTASLASPLAKGAARAIGMVAKDFDPAMKDIYQDGDTRSEKPKTKADQSEVSEYKNILVDVLRSAPLYPPQKRMLQMTKGKHYVEEMATPEYKRAIDKILAGKVLDGKEIQLLKKVVSELEKG